MKADNSQDNRENGGIFLCPYSQGDFLKLWENKIEKADNLGETIIKEYWSESFECICFCSA